MAGRLKSFSFTPNAAKITDCGCLWDISNKTRQLFKYKKWWCGCFFFFASFLYHYHHYHHHDCQSSSLDWSHHHYDNDNFHLVFDHWPHASAAAEWETLWKQTHYTWSEANPNSMEQMYLTEGGGCIWPPPFFDEIGATNHSVGHVFSGTTSLINGKIFVHFHSIFNDSNRPSEWEKCLTKWPTRTRISLNTTTTPESCKNK